MICMPLGHGLNPRLSRRHCHRARRSEAHFGATPSRGGHFASIEAADMHLTFHDRGGIWSWLMERRAGLGGWGEDY